MYVSKPKYVTKNLSHNLNFRFETDELILRNVCNQNVSHINIGHDLINPYSSKKLTNNETPIYNNKPQITVSDDS